MLVPSIFESFHVDSVDLQRQAEIPDEEITDRFKLKSSSQRVIAYKKVADQCKDNVYCIYGRHYVIKGFLVAFACYLERLFYPNPQTCRAPLRIQLEQLEQLELEQHF